MGNAVEVTESGWRRAGLWPNVSLGEMIAATAAERPDALLHAYSSRGERTATLEDIHGRGRRLAAALVRRGVCPGDVVAVQLPNWLENAVVSQAVAILGGVLLPIVHIFGPAELGFILADSRAVAFIVPDCWHKFDYLDRLKRLPDLPSLRTIIVLGETIPDGAQSLAALMDEEVAGETFLSVRDADDPALLLYTSGTTAEPKGVVHSSRSFIAELLSQIHEGEPLECWLSPWPAGHIAGTIGVLGHALLGRPMVIMDAWDPQVAARLIEERQVAQLSGTPLHLSGLMAAARSTGNSLRSLHTFLLGATTVPESLVLESERAGIRCCRCYGSTELPTLSQGRQSDPTEKRLLTDGSLNAGCAVRIVDEEGRDLPLGTEGELAVKGPELFLRYTDPVLDEAAFLPGRWFLSGDIGLLDAEGFVTITDRKKDIIIRGGENISSREVEGLVLRLPGVGEAAAIGLPDQRLGERVCVVLVTQSGAAAPSLAQIGRAFADMGVAVQKTPEAVLVVAELPRTPTGKVQKAELRRMVAAGELSPYLSRAE